MKKDYSATETKIRELVPRLLECKKGAIFINPEDGIKCEVIEVVESIPFLQSFYYIEENGSTEYTELNWQKDVKIIGYKITLEDVLEAIDPFGNWGVIAGHIASINRRESSYVLEVSWDYGKDFSQQKEETKEFIKNLLK